MPSHGTHPSQKICNRGAKSRNGAERQRPSDTGDCEQRNGKSRPTGRHVLQSSGGGGHIQVESEDKPVAARHWPRTRRAPSPRQFARATLSLFAASSVQQAGSCRNDPADFSCDFGSPALKSPAFTAFSLASKICLRLLLWENACGACVTLAGESRHIVVSRLLATRCRLATSYSAFPRR